LQDRSVRLLLTRVTRADYGSRAEDWQRWQGEHRRRRQGLAPRPPRREAVSLELLWQAPVGLTGWFSTILPIDGQIYIASLGVEFDSPKDAADGVVRVDGTTGASEPLFNPEPERRGPSDVIGLAAAGGDGLFVACYNGFVYAIDRAGRPRWSAPAHAGDPIVGPPLACNVDRDGTVDVLVPTRSGKVIALSGRRHGSLWVTPIARPPAGASLLGATLTLVQLRRTKDPAVMATLPTGETALLNIRNGQVLWRHNFTAGSLAGAISMGAEEDQPAAARSAGQFPALFLGDRAGCIWGLVESRQLLDAVAWESVAVRADETLIAAPRTLSLPRLAAPFVLICPTGDYAAGLGAVCALSADGVYWRYPVDGAVWGTPAVADLNGDGSPEIVVTSIEMTPEQRRIGMLTVLSASGFPVQRVALEAPVECSPVVADVNGDSKLEVLVADQGGVLHCFATGRYAPVQWGMLGGDSHGTRNAANAYSYAQRFLGDQWQWEPDR
ncbi:MAG: PQQ-binding-like beta-propeller repeat protein, partial [Planctomycetota bacterium]